MYHESFIASYIIGITILILFKTSLDYYPDIVINIIFGLAILGWIGAVFWACNVLFF